MIFKTLKISEKKHCFDSSRKCKFSWFFRDSSQVSPSRALHSSNQLTSFLQNFKKWAFMLKKKKCWVKSYNLVHLFSLRRCIPREHWIMHAHGQGGFINWVKCGDFPLFYWHFLSYGKSKHRVLIYSCCGTPCKSRYVTIFCVPAQTDGSADFQDRSGRHWKKKQQPLLKQSDAKCHRTEI